VLDSAQHVLVVYVSRVEVVEGLELVSMLEIVHAFLGTMVFENYEFLTFVFGEFSFEFELLLGEVEGFTYRSLGVYAC
jgi:hypothetical protein